MDNGQYRPLSPIEILNYFEEVKTQILDLKALMSTVIELNGLQTTPPKPARKTTVAKKTKHDDVEEDKKLINEAIAKHDKDLHPGKPVTKIKKGGRVAAKTSRKR